MPNDLHEHDEVTQSPELARVEADIARTRERVSRSVLALRAEISKRADWRDWVRRKPGLLMATAFMVGFIWGRRR